MLYQVAVLFDVYISVDIFSFIYAVFNFALIISRVVASSVMISVRIVDGGNFAVRAHCLSYGKANRNEKKRDLV